MGRMTCVGNLITTEIVVEYFSPSSSISCDASQNNEPEFIYTVLLVGPI